MGSSRGSWRRWRRTLAALAVVVASACGGDGGPTGPDAALAPFVGDWVATELVLTSVANPDIAPDLIGLGAVFTMNVQPSGQYTAILIYAQQASTEIGTLRVSGNTLTLNRDFPSRAVTSGTYSLSGNVLTLDGNTEFDFNLDGTPDAALVHFRLVKE